MTTRTKHLLRRSRDLLERSRVAAVQFLDPPRGETTALPRVIEGSRESIIHQEPEGAVVDICASIALRDLNLVDSLLSLLERMEESEGDPERLTELYKLDHLAARLRRNAENLRVLAGRDASDAVSDTASLVDVIRAAMSSIDGYSRVSIGRVLSLGVVGIAADDLSRLLAELLDNAAKQSPPDTSVRVSAHLTDSGSVLMRIEDDGIGMPAERVAELNGRLSDEPKLNDDSVRHMGLAVVRRLAARHDMRVRLDRRSPHGTTATVLLPGALLCELPGEAWSGSQTVTRSAAPAHLPADEPESVPAARRPPRHAAEHTATTTGGLPRRTPAGGRVATRPPQPQDLTDPGHTVNGLPRRVSRSIKNPDHGDAAAPVAPATPATPAQEKAGHEQLLADLDAFTAGEQAAKEAARPAGTDPDTDPAGVHQVAEGAPAVDVAEAAQAEPSESAAAEPEADVAGPAQASDPRTDPAAHSASERAADRGPEPGAFTESGSEPLAGSASQSAPGPTEPLAGLASRFGPEPRADHEPEPHRLAEPESLAGSGAHAVSERAADREGESVGLAGSVSRSVSESPADDDLVPQGFAEPGPEPLAGPASPSTSEQFAESEPLAGSRSGSERADHEPETFAEPDREPDVGRGSGLFAEPERPAAPTPFGETRRPDGPEAVAPPGGAGYAPGGMFDAAADSTPTPPRGMRIPVEPESGPEHGRHQQPGGTAS